MQPIHILPLLLVCAANWGLSAQTTPKTAPLPDPILWLRADRGVTSAGGTVTTWEDQSPEGNDATSEGTQVFYNVAAGELMNFNPAISFNQDIAPDGRLVGIEPLPILNGNTVSNFTTFIVPVERDLDDGNCGDDVFNFFNSENLLEVENFVPKGGCAGLTNQYTYGVFNGGEQQFVGVNHVFTEVITIYFDDSQPEPLVARVNGAPGRSAAVNPYRDPLVGPYPYSVGQAAIGRTINDMVASVDIGEVLIYPGRLDDQQLELVETYLAVKYGVTLNEDYLAPDGAVLWDSDGAQLLYNNEVGAIGREDCFSLDQRQSRSDVDESIVTIGVGTISASNAANPNEIGADNSYLFWGGDTLEIEFSGAGGPDGFNNRYGRLWQVRESSGGGPADVFDNLTVGFDRGVAELDGPDDLYVLLIDGDEDFSDARVVSGATSVDGRLEFTGVNLNDGEYFTLGTPSCDLSVSVTNSECVNEDEFTLSLSIDYNYGYLATATDRIRVQIAGNEFFTEPLSGATGVATLDVDIKGCFPFALLEAEFTTSDLCLATQGLGLLNCDEVCVVAPDEITGQAFEDFNLDGILDEIEIGYPGFIISAYNCANELVASDTTDDDGIYMLNVPPGDRYRVEFFPPEGSTFSAEYVDATDGIPESDVHFLDAGTCGADIGAITPEFCDASTAQFVPACFTRVSPQDVPNADVIVSVLASEGGSSNDPADYRPTVTPIHVGVGEVGPIYGLAYNREDFQLYAAATVKAGTIFPDGGGFGDIYVIDNSANTGGNNQVTTAEPWLDLDDFVDLGIYRTDETLPGALDDGVNDAIFEIAGKAGIGDIELDVDGTELFAVNLNERSLIVIPIAEDGSAETDAIVEVAIPNPTDCDAKGVVRPWALARRPGEPFIYVGTVCDASLTQERGDLRAYVFRFDPATNTFEEEPIADLVLDYPRQTNHGNSLSTEWDPWIQEIGDAAEDVQVVRCCGSTYFVGYPQPMFTDMAFDRGDLILGFTDRFSYQLRQIPEGSPKAFSPGKDFILSNGDLIRAYLNEDSDTYSIENGGRTFGRFTGPLTTGGFTDRLNVNAGPGGEEFYWEDGYRLTAQHYETHVAGLAQISGYLLAANHFDPVRNATRQYGTGGINFFDNNNGNWIKGVLLYGQSAGGRVISVRVVASVTSNRSAPGYATKSVTSYLLTKTKTACKMPATNPSLAYRSVSTPQTAPCAPLP